MTEREVEAISTSCSTSAASARPTPARSIATLVSRAQTTIGVSLSYWVIHALALSLGKAGLLPPMLAAWTANIIFTGLGTAGFLRVRT
jgi:lipopolysaccharide export LptBFGC system permease protein LptF